MLEQNLAQLLLKISSEKHMGMTEIQDWCEENLNENKRTTIRNVKKLIKQKFIEKIKVTGYGHKRYRTIVTPYDTGHKMYTKRIMLKKEPLLQTQTEIGRDIYEVTKIFYNDFKNGNTNEFSQKDFMIIKWILNLHSKLTWAINFGWFGHSKREIHLAETNRNNLEKVIKTINKMFFKKYPEFWFKIMHAIYDNIDYEMYPLTMVWSRLPISSNNITVRKRNK